MNQRKVSNVLQFMHTQDRKAGFLQLLNEIEEGKQTFNPESIINTLQQWYNESQDKMYLDWIEYVKTI
ncbi:hypothetical protein D3C73_278140 [compost metagenome]